MHRIICRISGDHVVAREYLALMFLNDCSESSYIRLVLFETEKSSNLASFGNMYMKKQISKQEDNFQLS
jgi:hypothetical protein